MIDLITLCLKQGLNLADTLQITIKLHPNANSAQLAFAVNASLMELKNGVKK
jgi:hypothetical protein